MAGARLDEFAGKAVYSANREYYFAKEAAIEIIARCEKEQIPIYGIDGALIENGRIREPIDAILDLSGCPHAYDDARWHLGRVEHLNLVWCFTLGDDPDTKYSDRSA